MKLHEPLPTVILGEVSRSCTMLPQDLVLPTNVNQITRAQFVQLPELETIVDHLEGFTATQDFYVDDAARSIDDILGKEVGVDRCFTIAINGVSRFFKRNSLLQECYPFVYGGIKVVGQTDFVFSAAAACYFQ